MNYHKINRIKYLEYFVCCKKNIQICVVHTIFVKRKSLGSSCTYYFIQNKKFFRLFSRQACIGVTIITYLFIFQTHNRFQKIFAIKLLTISFSYFSLVIMLRSIELVISLYILGLFQPFTKVKIHYRFTKLTDVWKKQLDLLRKTLYILTFLLKYIF